MRTFLGVDGGGSKTDFLLIDETGRVMASHRGGSAYYLEIGLEALQAMLAAGIRATLGKAGITASQLEFAFLGIPAYGEDRAVLSHVDRIVAELLPLERHRVDNDMVCGWAGALACCDGINIVAGTGSIAYGEFARRRARAGGWGQLFSDEGSAYWIAREALTLFSRMSDRRAPRGKLYELISERFQLRADLDLCAAVYGPPSLSRSELAALAPVAARAAREGDAAACQLFERAARELASIVDAVRDQLDVPQDFRLPVSYSGGMFRLEYLLKPMLEAALAAGDRSYEFVAPRLAPAAGAVLYAAKLGGVALTAESISELARAFGDGAPVDTDD